MSISLLKLLFDKLKPSSDEEDFIDTSMINAISDPDTRFIERVALEIWNKTPSAASLPFVRGIVEYTVQKYKLEGSLN